MTLKRYNVGPAGLDVAGISVVSGAGAPDGTGVSAGLVIGSLYIDNTAGNLYIKISSDNAIYGFAKISAIFPYDKAVLSDFPSAYWRVSGGGLVDVVGSANIPSLPSGVSVSTGILPAAGGQSLTFTGANAVTITAGAWAPTGNADRSMEIWFSTTIAPAVQAAETYPGLLGYGSTGADRLSFFFRPAANPDATPADQAYVVWTWADDLTVTGSTDWNTGNPLHGVVTYKGSTRNLRLYINGVLAGQKTLAANLSTPTGTLFRIGGNGLGVPWTGKLQEIAIYPTELSAARVLAHYNAGVGI